MLPLSHDRVPSYSTTLREPFFKTSWVYQLVSVGTDDIPASTLLQAINAAAEREGFNVNETNEQGRTLLLQLLAQQRSPINVHEKTREALLAEQHEVDGSGQTRVNRTIGLALALLDLGADPWLTDHEGRDVLHQAMHTMWLPLLDRLWAMPKAPTAEALEQRRFTLSGKTVGLPLLHAFAANGNAVLLTMLLQRGMDPNALDHSGRSPLFLAQHPSVVKALLDHGANVGQVLPNGVSLGQYWAENANAQRLKAMTALVLPYQKKLQAAEPFATSEGTPVDSGAVLAQRHHMLALRSLAMTSTKDNLVTHLKRYHLNVDAPLDANEAHEVNDARIASPLLHDVVEDVWANPKRSCANLTFLLEHSTAVQTQDPRTDAIVFGAWMVALSNTGTKPYPERLRAQVEGLFEQRFAWSSAQGMASMAHAFLGWVAQRTATLNDDDLRLSDEKAFKKSLKHWSQALLKGLERVVLGEYFSMQNNLKLDRSTRRFDGRNFKTLVDPDWVALRGPEGQDLAWQWASWAAMGSARSKPVMEVLAHGTQHSPAAALGPHALNAVTGWIEQSGGLNDTDLMTLLDALLRAQAPFDVNLPHQLYRMTRLQQLSPTLGNRLEALALRQTVDEMPTVATAATGPSARRRL